MAGKKYPDILALTNNGQNIYGARQNMDITHAGYLFHCERVIRAMMEHIKDVPHIIGFQLDNETKATALPVCVSRQCLSII